MRTRASLARRLPIDRYYTPNRTAPGLRQGRGYALRLPDGATAARGRRGLRRHHDRAHGPRRQPPGDDPQLPLHQQPLAPVAALASGVRARRPRPFPGTESGGSGSGSGGGGGGGGAVRVATFVA